MPAGAIIKPTFLMRFQISSVQRVEMNTWSLLREGQRWVTGKREYLTGVEDPPGSSAGRGGWGAAWGYKACSLASISTSAILG